MNNREYNVLKKFMRGQPGYASANIGRFIAMDLDNPFIDFQSLARSMGVLVCVELTAPRILRPQWLLALAAVAQISSKFEFLPTKCLLEELGLVTMGLKLGRAAKGWSIALHGGAGVSEHEAMPPNREAAYQAGLQSALGPWLGLLCGKRETALNAVQAVVGGAGGRSAVQRRPRGRVPDRRAQRARRGHHRQFETTAEQGAVAKIPAWVRNPVALARAVMEHSPHVMLIGSGAESFAAEAGFERVDPGYFFTRARWEALIAELVRRNLPIPLCPVDGRDAPCGAAGTGDIDDHRFGTVGAVARDRAGHLAVATSTGATTVKRPVVSDTPIIGVEPMLTTTRGTPCRERCDGGYFIRLAFAHRSPLLVRLCGYACELPAGRGRAEPPDCPWRTRRGDCRRSRWRTRLEFQHARDVSGAGRRRRAVHRLDLEGRDLNRVLSV